LISFEQVLIKRVIQSFGKSESAVQMSQNNQTDPDEQERAKRQTQDLLSAYRLAGITVTDVNGNKFRLQFETSYNGRYYEPYHIELEENQKLNKITSHTLPYFVPIENVEQEHLQASLGEFSRIIHDYLCCYVRRREQIFETKNKFLKYFTKEPESTFSCDYCRIDLAFKNDTTVSIVIMYDLLKDTPQKN